MTMTPRLRKFTLTAHVTSSVGWLGAVAAFLALAVAGLTSRDAQVVLSADLAMDLIAWFVIIPLCFASLLTGLVSSLGTPLGLFRHYWVLVKLLLTIPATIVLLVHMRPISLLAGVAAKTTLTLSSADLHGLRNLLVTAAGAALLVLLVTTTLSVYKPQGLTRYGARQQHQRSKVRQSIPRRQLTRNRGDTSDRSPATIGNAPRHRIPVAKRSSCDPSR